MDTLRTFCPALFSPRHLGGGLTLLLIVLLQGQGAYADAVSDWNSVANTVVVRSGRPAGAVILDMAYVHLAIYDAVNAITRHYTPFAVTLARGFPSWASQEAATAAAAHGVLLSLYPEQRRYLDSVYQASVNGLNNDARRLFGLVVGEQVASAFLAQRSGDGRNAVVPYTFGAGPGVYEMTPGAPPPPATPQTPWIAKMRPFTMLSDSQFRAAAPPELSSELYARDLSETKMYGAHDNSLRTATMTNLGLMFTDNPAAQLSRNIQLLAGARNLRLEENARLFAQVYVTIADAVIGTWESKYYYNRWRPVTAIRAAAATGANGAAPADTGWLPLAVTPGHPEYPAAHGAATGGFAYALEKFFGSPNVFTVLTSTSVPGFSMYERAYISTNHIVEAVIDARVYGGMHFRTSVERGALLAHEVAAWVADHYFKLRQPSTGSPAASATASGTDETAQADGPQNYGLLQNYPNPFNPETVIGFRVRDFGPVKLTVFDMLGREVVTLVNESKSPGEYAVKFGGTGLASGTYVYRLEAGAFQETRRMLLVK